MNKVIMIILDGFGVGKNYDGNAIELANMDCYKELLDVYPNTLLATTGENVDTPEDHGTLYSTNKYIDNIKWLWSSNEIEKEYPKIPYDYSTLLKILNPIVVDLSEKDSYIKVVRVLSEKLLPIGFGYKADYNTHSIIKELDFNKESLKLPHYFA